MERFSTDDERFERVITDEERRIMGMYALLEVNMPRVENPQEQQ